MDDLIDDNPIEESGSEEEEGSDDEDEDGGEGNQAGFRKRKRSSKQI